MNEKYTRSLRRCLTKLVKTPSISTTNIENRPLPQRNLNRTLVQRNFLLYLNCLILGEPKEKLAVNMSNF